MAGGQLLVFRSATNVLHSLFELRKRIREAAEDVTQLRVFFGFRVIVENIITTDS